LMNYFRNPKLEVDNTQLTCMSIEILGQVLISVGWLLETGTDPWWLSGWFLGFITTVLKKSKTGKSEEKYEAMPKVTLTLGVWLFSS
jgi:hypothetical protein